MTNTTTTATTTRITNTICVITFLHHARVSTTFSPQVLGTHCTESVFQLSTPGDIRRTDNAVVAAIGRKLLNNLNIRTVTNFSYTNGLSDLLVVPIFNFIRSAIFFVTRGATTLRPNHMGRNLQRKQQVLLMCSLKIVTIYVNLQKPLLQLFAASPTTTDCNYAVLTFRSIAYLFITRGRLFRTHLHNTRGVKLCLTSDLKRVTLGLLTYIVLIPHVNFTNF